MDIGIRYFIWFVFYSMIGWFYETTLYMFTERKFVDKSFLSGPFCPVYGLGAVAIIIFLTPFKNNIFLLFTYGAVIACTVEYSTAFFLKKIFDHREWDYSWRRFNLHGRVCLLGAVVFGGFSVLLVRYIHPAVEYLSNQVSLTTFYLIGLSLLVLQIIDFYITFKNLYHIKK